MKKVFMLIVFFFFAILAVGCFESNKEDDTSKDGVIDWNDLDPEGDKEKDPNGGNTEDPNGGSTEDPNGGDNGDNPDPADLIVKEIKITIDTTNYTGTIEGDKCTIDVSHDKSYTYIFATVKAKEGYSISKDVKLYVNGELKEYKETFDKYIYSINEANTELEYKIKDPNWTPVY